MAFEAMSGVESGFWGLLGGFIVEGLEYSAAIRRAKGWPWRRRGEPGLLPSLVAILLRVAASAALATAAGSSGQIAGAFGALSLGITAPLVVEKILQQVGNATIEARRPAATPRGAPSSRQQPARDETERSDAN